MGVLPDPKKLGDGAVGKFGRRSEGVHGSFTPARLGTPLQLGKFDSVRAEERIDVGTETVTSGALDNLCCLPVVIDCPSSPQAS